jgi:hypothetical protein
MPASSLEPEVDKLFQLPLEQFTAARNALAKEAGANRHEIRSLQKPPVPAWAVNQLYWKRRPVYDALIDAASTLRTAHKAVLAGKRTDLRAASKEHEDAIENALKAALALLIESGNAATDTTKQAIATTLRGLPSDERPGRLTRTLQPGGFEALAGIPVRPIADGRTKAAPRAAEPARREPDTAKTTEDTKAIARAREAVATATRALKLAEHTARREEFEAARAARDVEKAEREVDNAKEQVEAAKQALEAAGREAAKIRRARETAVKRSKDADAALAAAQAEVRAAERDVEKLSKSRSR